MTTIITIPDGRLCSDPRLNDAPSGSKVANLRIATNYRVKDGDEWVSEALFMDVEIWKGADAIAQYFAKGSPISVWGELQERSWIDQNTGAERTSLVVKNAGWAFPPKPVDDTQQAQPQATSPQQQGYRQPPAQPQYQGPPAAQPPQYQPPAQAPPAQQPFAQPAPAAAGDDGIPW